MKSLHSPNFSAKVFGRRIGEELLDLLCEYGHAAATRGGSLKWQTTYPSQSAYCNAVRRLREAGFVASCGRMGERTLVLTDAAPRRDVLRPDRLWDEKWQGYWSVLVYDVPEDQRVFRNGLRRFLARLRMGCLQKSVWVGPRDIRPEYDDLVQALGMHWMSYLFEARTVLGRSPQDIVRVAWDFERIEHQHSVYLDACQRNLEALGSCKREMLETLAREEMSLYVRAMGGDPLLPGELLPSGYLGRGVFDLHRRFVSAVSKSASSLLSRRSSRKK